jgi:hypothetical protein
MGKDEKERQLQERILASPSRLPGFDGPAAAADEVPVRHAGSADVVAVNQKGEIAIVECKRASNPDCRRWVIGQVFEYAAGLWKLNYEHIKRLFKACGTELTNPFEGGAGWDEESFGRDVSRNLENGEFRMFIAVDEMTEALRKRLDRTVTFLNGHLPNVQLLAVAWPPGGGLEEYGGSADGIRRLPPKLGPDRSTLIEEIGSPDPVRVANGLLDWAEDKESPVKVDYKRSKPDGIVCVFERPGGDALFKITEQGIVHVSFTGLRRRRWEQESINRLVHDLGKIDERFQIDTKRKSSRPEAPLESLAQEGKREEFLRVMQRVLETPAIG